MLSRSQDPRVIVHHIKNNKGDVGYATHILNNSHPYRIEMNHKFYWLYENDEFMNIKENFIFKT
jgi:hypothetical protein